MASLAQVKAQKEIVAKVNEVDLSEIGLGIITYSLTTEMLEEQRTKEQQNHSEMLKSMQNELRKKGINIKNQSEVIKTMIDRLGSDLADKQVLIKLKKNHEDFFYNLDPKINKHDVMNFFENELGDFANEGYENFLAGVYNEYIELVNEFNTPISK
jgi:hypothetical protein